MRTIFKYDVDGQTAEIRGEILSVGVQHGDMKFWAIHDEEIKPKRVKIHVYGTGHPLPKYAGVEHHSQIFIGTVIDGPFVWHLFSEEL